MRGASSDHDWPLFVFLCTCLWRRYHKSLKFWRANVAIHFPWVTKMFQDNENSWQLLFTQKFYLKTSQLRLDFVDTSVDSLFNCILCVAKSWKSRGGNVFVFTSPEARVLYFAQIIVNVCLFSNKDVNQWKFCKSKGKIGTSKT